MRITKRDVQLLQDMALSHVLSRDQVVALGYFGSATRANTRLRGLIAHGLVQRLETPFFRQSLYIVGRKALDLLGTRIGPLASARSGSPRFLQHALSVTNARIRLLARGATAWRFEQQLNVAFTVGAKSYEVRPDGLAILAEGRIIAVEVDLGHVAPAKFRAKLEAYDRFVASEACALHWPAASFRLLTLCPGRLRAARLAALTPPNCHFEHFTQTFTDFGVQSVGAWS